MANKADQAALRKKCLEVRKQNNEACEKDGREKEKCLKLVQSAFNRCELSGDSLKWSALGMAVLTTAILY